MANSIKILSFACMLSVAVLSGLGCAKLHKDPSPPQIPGNAEVMKSMREVQMRLERLRLQREYAQDRFSEAEDALIESRKLYEMGHYRESYDMVLKANARMNAALAASLLSVNANVMPEIEKELSFITGHMRDMEFEVNMKITMNQARTAIEYVDDKVVRVKEHVTELSDELREAENLLDYAKKHYQMGNYQKAFNLAVNAAEKADVVLPVDILGNDLGFFDAIGIAGRQGGRGPLSKTVKRVDYYKVRKRDSLWTISGRREVYGDPVLWPLIFEANRDKIKNPDIIIEGWKLRIKRGLNVKTARKAYKQTAKVNKKDKLADKGRARKASVGMKKRSTGGRVKKMGTPVPTPRTFAARGRKPEKSPTTAVSEEKVTVGRNEPAAGNSDGSSGEIKTVSPETGVESGTEKDQGNKGTSGTEEAERVEIDAESFVGHEGGDAGDNADGKGSGSGGMDTILQRIASEGVKELSGDGAGMKDPIGKKVGPQKISSSVVEASAGGHQEEGIGPEAVETKESGGDKSMVVAGASNADDLPTLEEIMEEVEKDSQEPAGQEAGTGDGDKSLEKALDTLMAMDEKNAPPDRKSGDVPESGWEADLEKLMLDDLGSSGDEEAVDDGSEENTAPEEGGGGSSIDFGDF